jgi:hypothetical protein
METRAMAIAFFYAVGTIVGGFGGPLLFGWLIESGEPSRIFVGYVVGAVVMIFGGIVQAAMGVESAQRDLEDIAPPMSAVEAEIDEPGEEADPYTLGRGEGRGTAHASDAGAGAGMGAGAGAGMGTGSHAEQGGRVEDYVRMQERGEGR